MLYFTNKKSLVKNLPQGAGDLRFNHSLGEDLKEGYYLSVILGRNSLELYDHGYCRHGGVLLHFYVQTVDQLQKKIAELKNKNK